MHAIQLKKNKKPLYNPIYKLDFIKLKNFKTYIIINLFNVFIKL